MTTRLVKALSIRTQGSAVKACRALLESERLYEKAELEGYGWKFTNLADSKLKEALAHAKKVIAACEGK